MSFPPFLIYDTATSLSSSYLPDLANFECQ